MEALEDSEVGAEEGLADSAAVEGLAVAVAVPAGNEGAMTENETGAVTPALSRIRSL